MLANVPQRPRSHQLETETRTAFEGLLPSEWVYRPISPDYGLDGEIEVFAGEHATGQRFAVQLKGTDATGTDALAIRLELATCRYYRSIDVPVLLVRYVASTNLVYVRWFHALDRATTEGQSTVTLRLREEDVWSDSTPERLVRGLEAFRWVHRPAPELPLPVRVVTTVEALSGVPAAEWRRRIRATMARVPGLLRSPLEGDLALGPTIELRDGEVRANLLDVFSVAVPLIDLGIEAERLAALPADSLLVLALALAEAGHVGLAARLTVEFAAESVLFREGAVAAPLADALARDHQVVAALELSEELKARGETYLVASWLLDVAALRVSHALSGRELAKYLARLQAGVRAAEEAGEEHAAAVAHYNLANHLRGKVLPRQVFRHYRRAAQLHPPYRDYEYWRREVAGVLFEGGRYQASAFFYEAAQQLGSDWPLDGLLGDALMFSGRYAEARDAYALAAADPEQSSPEWVLKAWALGWALESGHPAVQTRDVRAAEELASTTASEPPAERMERFNAALAADLLCALAWFNRGVMHVENGELQEALGSFLVAALCQRGDVEAWANALSLAVSDPELHERMSRAPWNFAAAVPVLMVRR